MTGNGGYPIGVQHEYEEGDEKAPMHTDPLCKVCGQPRIAIVHALVSPRIPELSLPAVLYLVYDKASNEEVAHGLTLSEARAMCINNTGLDYSRESK